MKLVRRSAPLLVLAAFAAILTFASASGAQGPPAGFSLPPQAQEVGPGIYYLGSGVDAGLPVVGYAYEHHRAGHNGGPSGGGDGGGGEDPPADASGCYSYIANGARWLTPETVTINPANNFEVSAADIQGWMEKWETARGESIYGGFATTNAPLSADSAGTDGLNEVYFAPIAENGVLGYTIVWSSRIGPRSSRPIVEADMVIDPEWSWQVADENTVPGESSIGAGNLDLVAVFAHEAGHFVGLGHTEATAECEAQTMFPSIAAGDDRKQSLDVGDIAGVIDLYN